MRVMQSRRGFLASAAAASLLGSAPALADEEPPETTMIRLRRDLSVCAAPWFIGEDLLRAEGFTDVRNVPVQSGPALTQAFAHGEIDFALLFAGTAVRYLDDGAPIAVVGGVHAGCFELFAHEPIQAISDLKGKRVGIDVLGSGKYAYVALMAAYVGLDPRKDIEWIEGRHLNPMELFAERKVDAFLGFPPEPQELRARQIGHVIVSTTTDKPWSQYFCCMLVGSRDFIRSHPVATKRVLRVVLKTNEMCATQPERVAQQLVDYGMTNQYDYALETLRDIPYAQWREFDPEDTLRFLALRLNEVGMIKSNPKALITEGIDLRFLNELKRELKA